MKKIDIHLHMFKNINIEPHNKDIQSSSPEEMKQHLNSKGFQKGVLLSVGEQNGGNEDLKQISDEYPDTFHWMCNIDDYDHSSIFERMEEYKSKGAVGVGELTINKYINSDIIQRIFDSAQQLDMPVLFHMSPQENFNYGIVDYPGLTLLEEALNKYPKLKIIGHSQPFWHEISKDASTDRDIRNSWGEGRVIPNGRLSYLLEKYDNLYADLSANSGGQAILRDEEHGIMFLEKFQDKLLFGSDIVHIGMYFPLADWLDNAHKNKKLSSAAYDKIFFSNAKRVLKI